MSAQQKIVLAVALVGALAVGGVVTSVPKARAEMLFTAAQDGGNVVFTISGEVNTSVLTNVPYGGSASGAAFFEDTLAAGTSGAPLSYSVPGANLTSLFNASIFVFSDSDSGAVFGMNSGNGTIYVPAGYVSGTLIDGTSTFDATTLAGLGLIPGASYTYNYGTGVSADSMVFNIAPTPAPEPASMALLTIGLLGVGAARRRKL